MSTTNSSFIMSSVNNNNSGGGASSTGENFAKKKKKRYRRKNKKSNDRKPDVVASSDTKSSSSSSSSNKSGNNRRRQLSRKKRGQKVKRFNDNAPVLAQSFVEKNAQLASTLIAKLASDEYECCVCCDRIGRRGKIWSCPRCFVIIHFSCVRAWADASAASEWLCPGCLHSVAEAPKNPRCFCGSTVDPQYDAYLTPHSCGSVCGRERGNGCTHTCTMLCHPGSCPPCAAMVERQCYCGESVFVERCGESWTGRSCEKMCGRLLNCGVHTCSQICHAGDCDSCDTKVSMTCHCGRSTTDRVCDGSESYSCDTQCGALLECGNHVCRKKCHSGFVDHTKCERMPAVPQLCACGATTHNDVARESCLEELPVCDNVCSRLLECGHHNCSQTCHDSPCPPCTESTMLSCVCGRRSKRVKCGDMGKEVENLFQCNKKCYKMLSCGKHKCQQVCCPGGVDEHRCLRVCDAPLNCGNHECPLLCHLGYCDPCPIILRNGVSCPCGKTRITRAVPCGTEALGCKEKCTHERECGHPCVYQCHPPPCPPCVTLVSKRCAGDHCDMLNIPCNVKNVSCGALCGRLRECGLHTCARQCHGGSCGNNMNNDDDNVVRSCGQPCGRVNEVCGHPCGARCHPGGTCPSEACRVRVETTCDCGRIKRQVQCCERHSVVLMCDDTCEKELRNKRLREALQLEEGRVRIPYPHLLLDKIIEEKLVSVCERVEIRVRDFVVDTSRNTLNMKAMPSWHRWLVHQMSGYYNLQSEAFDSGMRRFVRLVKTPLSSLPPMSLTNALSAYVSSGKEAKNAMDTSTMLHFDDLDQYPGIRPRDLHYVLRPWQGQYRLNWLDDTYAIAVFLTSESFVEARKEVDLKRIFRTHTDHEDDDDNDRVARSRVDANSGGWHTIATSSSNHKSSSSSPPLVPVPPGRRQPLVITTTSPFAVLNEDNDDDDDDDGDHFHDIPVVTEAPPDGWSMVSRASSSSNTAVPDAWDD